MFGAYWENRTPVNWIQISCNPTIRNRHMARGEGVEPPSLGLESKVIPLYDPRMKLMVLQGGIEPPFPRWERRVLGHYTIGAFWSLQVESNHHFVLMRDLYEPLYDVAILSNVGYYMALSVIGLCFRPTRKNRLHIFGRLLCQLSYMRHAHGRIRTPDPLFVFKSL